MEDVSVHVGLDVHKQTIAVAVLRDGVTHNEWQLENEPKAVAALVRRLGRMGRGDGDVVCCYEAGPTGFALQRTLQAAGIDCRVIAPALIPRKPGDRVKTDRRDALRLAELLRAGLLTEVHQPTKRQESVRNLTRAREDAVAARKRVQQQLSHFLLRANRRYDKSSWTIAHRRWLRGLRFEHHGDQAAFGSYLRSVEMADERIREIDAALAEVATSDDYREPVGLLRCFRGIDTVTALTILGELGDLTRFRTAPSLAAYVGLTPSEYSSGPVTSRGGITKTGNKHVRRVMVESAWHSIRRPQVGVALRKRREGQPAWAVAMADTTASRLHRRYVALIRGGKRPQVAVTALAREQICAVWAVLRTHADQRDQAA